MKLLLDTHIWIWAATTPKRLNRKVRRAIGSTSNEIWLSPVSILEFLTLHRKGKLKLATQDPLEWIQSTIMQFRFIEATYSNAVAFDAYRFELSHRDPTDRLLVATARVLDLTLVTSDESIIKAGVVAVLPND